MMNTKRCLLLCLPALMTGCLKTRTDVKDAEQRQVINQQVSTLQRDTADVNARFGEVNEEMRDLRGRVEVVENKLRSADGNADRTRQAVTEQTQDAARRLGLLQETITRMDTQMQAQNAEIAALKAEVLSLRAAQAGAAAAASSGSGGKKDSWAVANEHFDNKDWKKAILGYQEYREKNPKGKHLPEATYRMGVSFQELGLRDEAKTFYDEVVAKYGSSNEAKKAKTRLKGLKK